MQKVEGAVEGAVVSTGVAKGAPVAVGGTVSGLTVLGVPIPDVVPVLTCIYMLVCIGHTGWKWWNDWKKCQEEEEEDE